MSWWLFCVLLSISTATFTWKRPLISGQNIASYILIKQKKGRKMYVVHFSQISFKLTDLESHVEGYSFRYNDFLNYVIPSPLLLSCWTSIRPSNDLLLFLGSESQWQQGEQKRPDVLFIQQLPQALLEGFLRAPRPAGRHSLLFSMSWFKHLQSDALGSL